MPEKIHRGAVLRVRYNNLQKPYLELENGRRYWEGAVLGGAVLGGGGWATVVLK